MHFKQSIFLVTIALLALWKGPVANAQETPTQLVERVASMQDRAALEAFVSSWKNSADPEAPLYLGIALHNLDRAAPGKRAKEAVDILGDYRGKLFPALALAYRGSAVTLVASAYSASGNLAQASAKLGEGFALMDKAVKLDPANVVIRFMRAENGLEISETTPFSRLPEIESDVAELAKSLSSFSAESKAAYFLIRGRFYLLRKNAKEAMDSLYKAASAAPDSASAKKARALLARLED